MVDLYSGDDFDSGHGPVFMLWSWTGIQVTLILVMDRYSGYRDCGHGPVFRLWSGTSIQVALILVVDWYSGCFVVVYRY